MKRNRHVKVNYITSVPDAVYQGASSADGAEAERLHGIETNLVM